MSASRRDSPDAGADGILADQEGWKMAGIRVAQITRGAVVDRDKKRGEAIIASVTHQMLVQPGDEFGGA